MLIKPFGEIFDVEEQDLYSQTYIGEVVDNNDPEKLNRIKVNLELWSYMTTDEMPWVKQSGNGSCGASPENYSHNIPEIGSQVRVSFPSGNPDDPQYSGVEITSENKGSLFDEDYPNTYGHKDSSGNFWMVNKRTGITVYQSKAGTNVQIEDDGTVTITMPSKSYAYCDAAGNWFFKGPTCKITMDDEISLASNTINLGADKINLNAGFVSVNTEKTTDITAGAGINLNGGSAIVLNAKDTSTTGGFTAGNGSSGFIMDLLAKKQYIFNGGILTGVAP